MRNFIQSKSDSIDLVLIEKEYRKSTIFKDLENIDKKSIRALRTNDTSRLEDLEKQAEKLRQELRLLDG